MDEMSCNSSSGFIREIEKTGNVRQIGQHSHNSTAISRSKKISPPLTLFPLPISQKNVGRGIN